MQQAIKTLPSQHSARPELRPDASAQAKPPFAQAGTVSQRKPTTPAHWLEGASHLIRASGHRMADAAWATLGQALKNTHPAFEDTAQHIRAHHQTQAQAQVAKAQALGAITQAQDIQRASDLPNYAASLLAQGTAPLLSIALAARAGGPAGALVAAHSLNTAFNVSYQLDMTGDADLLQATVAAIPATATQIGVGAAFPRLGPGGWASGGALIGSVTAGSQQLSTVGMPLLHSEHSASLSRSALDGSLIGLLLGPASAHLQPRLGTRTQQPQTHAPTPRNALNKHPQYDLTKVDNTWVYLPQHRSKTSVNNAPANAPTPGAQRPVAPWTLGLWGDKAKIAGMQLRYPPQDEFDALWGEPDHHAPSLSNVSRPQTPAHSPRASASISHNDATLSARKQAWEALSAQLKHLPHEWIGPTRFLYFAHSVKPEHIRKLDARATHFLIERITRTLNQTLGTDTPIPQRPAVEMGQRNPHPEIDIARALGFNASSALTFLGEQQFLLPRHATKALPSNKTPLQIIETLHAQLRAHYQALQTGEQPHTETSAAQSPASTHSFIAAYKPVDLYPLSHQESSYLLKFLTTEPAILDGSPHRSARDPNLERLSANATAHLQQRIQQKLKLDADFESIFKPLANNADARQRLAADLLRHLDRFPKPSPDQANHPTIAWLRQTRALGIMSASDKLAAGDTASYGPLSRLPALQPLKNYALNLDELTLIDLLIHGFEYPDIQSALDLSAQSTVNRISKLRNKLGLKTHNIAGELFARYPRSNTTHQAPHGASYERYGQPLFDDVAALYTDLTPATHHPNTQALAHQRQDLLATAKTSFEPRAIETIFARSTTNAPAPQPLTRADLQALSLPAVSALKGSLSHSSAQAIAAQTGLSAQAIEVLRWVAPSWIGQASLPAMSVAFPSGPAKLRETLAHIEQARQQGQQYRSARSQAAAQPSAEPPPIDRTKLTKALLVASDTDIAALWAYVDGAFSKREIARITGTHRDYLDRYTDKLTRTAGVSKDRDSLQGALEQLAEGRPAQDFLWQLVTKRQQWAKTQTAVPLLTGAQIRAALADLHDGHLMLLRAWSEHPDLGGQQLSQRTALQGSTINTHKHAILKAFEVDSIWELDLRLPQGLTGTLDLLLVEKPSTTKP